MSCSLSSGSRSTRSYRRALRCPGSACEPVFQGHAVYSPGTCQPGTYQSGTYQPGTCQPGTCQPGPSLYGGCQDTYCAPTSCQTSCFRPRTSAFCSPCPSSYSGSSGCGPTGLRPFGYGSPHVQSLGCGPSFYRSSPTCFSSRSCQSACVQPAFSSRCFGPTY
ncbi:keratin-associated protein 15-1-like [Phyllostomus discolor]|uniref:Keratin-associated protein n=1 Tax=Phyllostomus discolor TaxID=89673 RepID=A0A6J2KWV9_9CHIR|nr:keratin-associated protein 15-1-like [Phyllostomus discolor]